MTNAQAALIAAATYWSGSSTRTLHKVRGTADEFLDWLDRKDKGGWRERYIENKRIERGHPKPVVVTDEVKKSAREEYGDTQRLPQDEMGG